MHSYVCRGLCACARHWPSGPPGGGGGVSPLRAGNCKYAPKGAAAFLPCWTLGALSFGLIGGFDARKCAENGRSTGFCSHCSHCSELNGNAGSPCLCGVPTVPTVPTQKHKVAKRRAVKACRPVHLFGRLCGTAGAQGLRGRGRVKSPQPPTGHRSSSWIFMRASFEGGGIRSLTVCCVVLGLNSMPDEPPVAPAFPACAPTL